MKKLLLAFLIVNLTVSVATAGKLRDNVGCGVGTLMMESAGHTNGGWLFQMTASWTNATLFNTFSATTGTVGCRGNINNVVGIEKMYEFAAKNMDNLAKDIAIGNGETINSLASMMNITDINSFGKSLQSNFNIIFPSADTQSMYVIDTIILLNS